MNPKQLNVIIGSKNPVKIKAITDTLSLYFPRHQIVAEGINAPSLVDDQPMNAEETLNGAVNRVRYCKLNHQADYYAAIEGGVEQTQYGCFTFAYIVIDNGSTRSISRSASLPLPKTIYQALEDGQELGDVMDSVFNESNVKQKCGAIGLLTQQLASRGSCYQQAAIMCMAPFINGNLYDK